MWGFFCQTDFYFLLVQNQFSIKAKKEWTFLLYFAAHNSSLKHMQNMWLISVGPTFTFELWSLISRAELYPIPLKN